MLLHFCRFRVTCPFCRCHCHFLGEKCGDEVFITIPPPPGGTAILPEYIHYYGYYYQVIVQCLST
jgi:hypothetical protein